MKPEPTEPEVDLYFFEGETWAVWKHAQQCQGCGCMCFILTNRFGSTLCVGCSDILGATLGVPTALREVAHV